MGRRRSSRVRDVTRPPEGQPWVWLTQEMLSSEAWRGRSINCARLIDFLLSEQMGHGGTENGNLKAPYAQLERFGIGRRFIPGAINEAERRGLIRVRRGSMRGHQRKDASLFRLTFYATRTRDADGTYAWHEATDDWRNACSPKI